MLKSLKAMNFRKLTDHQFDFTPGLNVIRAGNERGKSTILEAIAYALFSVKACRDPLDQIVTWGQPERTLKVELEFEYENAVYHIKRSKSGAEINWRTIPMIASDRIIHDAVGRVTGQTETKEFIERLLGVDGTVVGRLMMATQNSIRGALDEGGKATMQLIEQLADFDQIDSLLELISQNLQVGHTGPVEEKLRMLEEKAESLHGSMKEPDQAAFDQTRTDLLKKIDIAQSELSTEWKAKHEAAQTAVNNAQAAKQLRHSLSQNLERANNAFAVSKQRIVDAQAKASEPVATQRVAELQAQLDAAGQVQERLAAYERVAAANRNYPESYWDEGRESFDLAYRDAIAAVQAAAGEHSQCVTAVKQLKAQAAGGTKCGACGQELPNAAAIEAHNKERLDQLALAEKMLPLAKVKLDQANQTEAALKAIAKLTPVYEKLAIELAQYVDVNTGHVPPRVVWRGEKPAAVDVSPLKLELTQLEAKHRAIEEAKSRVKALTETLPEQEATIKDLEQKIAGCANADDLPALREKLVEVDSQYNLRVNAIGEYKARITIFERDHGIACANYRNHLDRQAEADKAVAQTKIDLENMNFNNTLQKTIKLARPVIADKLWSVVLAAVSTYFSTMRGEKSVVSREGNSFKVDGHVVGGGGLSGSALDLLGLAIRMALTRTFLPTAPFLILDEPAAAMDEERTRQMLGFLVAAGFQQTILVTHESESEAVADNLITI